MADWVEGTVTQVIDGDTFDLRVEVRGAGNVWDYGEEERIRIQGRDAPELGTPAGHLALIMLRKDIERRLVRCTVQARDKYGRLVCAVKVIQRRSIA